MSRVWPHNLLKQEYTPQIAENPSFNGISMIENPSRARHVPSHKPERTPVQQQGNQRSEAKADQNPPPLYECRNEEKEDSEREYAGNQSTQQSTGASCILETVRKSGQDTGIQRKS